MGGAKRPPLSLDRERFPGASFRRVPVDLHDTARKEKTMTIEETQFGNITVDGTMYDHDVIIRLSGNVEKRKKKLSKEKYGTSHVISKDEAKFVFEDGCEILIVGTGQEDNVRLSPEATDYFKKKGCKIMLQPTPVAIQSFNDSRERKIGLMHVTC
jgi:hypothetical protein